MKETFLQPHFKLKDLGVLRYFLTLEIARFARGITLNQWKCTFSLLDDISFLVCKRTSLPMDPNPKLNAKVGQPLEVATQYLDWLIDCPIFIYLILMSHLLLTNSVSIFSQPQDTHLHVAHHLLRYLKGTLGQGLLFSPSSNKLLLFVFTDAD